MVESGLCDYSTPYLWRLHRRLSDKYKKIANREWRDNLFNVKIELAERMFDDCQICERRCRVNRNKGEVGFCGLTNKPYYFSEFVNYGLELELVPSYSVYFSGCNFRCLYCLTWKGMINPSSWQRVNVKRIIDSANAEKEINNISFLGGLPDLHLPTALRIIKGLPSGLPVVWNSNMYFTKETFTLLKGAIKILTGDLRYGNDICAREISKVEDYTKIVRRNFCQTIKSCKIIVRHLLLPGHFKCCFLPCIDWLSTHLKDVKVSLPEYIPSYLATKDKMLRFRVSKEDLKNAKKIARDAGLKVIEGL